MIILVFSKITQFEFNDSIYHVRQINSLLVVCFLFLPNTVECRNNIYVHSKIFSVKFNKKQPMIQKNQNWKQNPYVPSIKNLSRKLFVLTLQKIFFCGKRNRTMKYNVVKIFFCKSENMYIFMYFGANGIVPKIFSK